MKTLNDYDAVVFGGGFAGFACAMKIRNETKRRVLLVEPRATLGWEATWAFQATLPNGVSTVADHIGQALETVGARNGDRIDTAATEVVLHELAEKAGIELLYYCHPVKVVRDDRDVLSVLVAGKSGVMAVRSKTYVDATENAFLSRNVGLNVCAPADSAAMFRIAINNIDAAKLAEGGASSLTDGTETRFVPSIWDGEIFVEYDVPDGSIITARQTSLEVLKSLRDNLDGMGNAIVTHMGHLVMPKGTVSVEGDGLNNLVAVGSRMDADGRNGLADRAAVGEKAADTVVAKLDGLSIPNAPRVYDFQPETTTIDGVVVCGGGAAGAVAGIAAAKRGANVTLLDAATCLGGAATGGCINSYCAGVKGGLQDEIDAKIDEITPLFGPKEAIRGFHADAKKIVMEGMVVENGGAILYEASVCGVFADEASKRLRSIDVATADGSKRYVADVFIDATGDGDVAAMAGVPYSYGRETDGQPHAYSQAGMELVDGPRLRHFNFDAGYCDPTDVVDLTRARIEGIKLYRRDKFAADNRFLYIAPQIGLRSSRFIHGDYQLTLNDEISWRSFPDAIAYTRAFFDDHGTDYENESDQAMLWVWVFGSWHAAIGCEVPYRCLLPMDLDGLLVACRAISLTHDAHYQLRMQNDMQRIGEAAGIAAALAAERGEVPRDVDVLDVQTALRESGGLNRPGENWKDDFKPREPEDGEFTELSWGEELPNRVFHLVKRGGEGAETLARHLNVADKRVRYWAAAGLAVLGDDRGAEPLAECVRERCDEKPGKFKTVPFWQPAILLLASLDSSSSIDVVRDVLKEENLHVDVALTAVRAFGRIGDAGAVADINALLDRSDIDTNRKLQFSFGSIDAATLDFRWQLELVAAEALAKLGERREDLVEKYLDDERATVRQFAEKVRAAL